ncbi:phage baseplate assembly protein V, partial [Salmonella enterica]|nr:phage baseplate assembly protein V [Salmonella enterica]EHP7375605.1 phage baseplate assembly protein V [Salmonella enterica]EIJ4781854.1 phage baseplate assembly protein V [Salmonella enterica]ELJ6085808.1 phage baseplate assembly protein V [Salmonella enterica]
TGNAGGHFTMSDATIAGVTYSGHTHRENGRGSNTGGPQNG